MKQAIVIDLEVYRKQFESQRKPQESHELDELSKAIILLIQRLRESNPLMQTG